MNFLRTALRPLRRMSISHRLGGYVLRFSTAYNSAIATIARLEQERAELKARVEELLRSGANEAEAELRATVLRLKLELGETQAALRAAEDASRAAASKEEVAQEQVWAYKTIVGALKRLHPEYATAGPGANALEDRSGLLRQRIKDLEVYILLGNRATSAIVDRDPES